MEKVRYGLIGFGGIAENRIAKEGFGLDTSRFKGNRRAELVVAWDPNNARAEVARSLGIRWAKSADEILEDPSIQAVVIASNNRTHAKWGLKALHAGKHIFLEKPAGVTEEEVQKLIEEAEARKLSFGVDHMMSKNAYNVLAKELLKDGYIGDIASIVLHMEFPFGVTPEEAATWRCSDPAELGGPIGDVASHCFYMSEYLLNCRIMSLRCVYTPKILPITVEDGAYITFNTETGITGVVRVAFNQERGSLEGTLQNLGYEIYGSKGFIEGKATLFQLSGHPDEPTQILLSSTVDGKIHNHVPTVIENIYTQQIAQHAESVQNGHRLTGNDALRNLRMVVLSHTSAQNGGKEEQI
jgi:predicted dehydrogenase